MIDYIKKIQTKSEDTRKRILFFSMVFSMFIVGLVWLYSLGVRFDSEVKEQAREDVKPFKMFSQSISDTYKNVQASVGKINSTENDHKEKSVEENIEQENDLKLIPVEYQ